MRNIVRERILKKCNYKCVECGSKEKLEVDHIIPLSIGGREDEDNMQILCKHCNAKKHNKHIYKGIIKLDENYEDYIMVHSEKALQFKDNDYVLFANHLMKVIEHPEKYLTVYGFENNG